MLLANSEKKKKKSMVFHEQSEPCVALRLHEYFSRKPKKLVAFATVLVAILSPTHKHVYAKIWNQKGTCTWKHHTVDLYQKIVQAIAIYSVSNSLKDWSVCNFIFDTGH